MRLRTIALLPVALCLACGSTPGPAGVNAIVFYDQDGSGVLSTTDAVRFPVAQVSVGGLTGTTTVGGGVTLTGVPDGTQPVSVSEESLPPYYVAGSPLSVQVPQESGHPVDVPVTLPIGNNSPNIYMAFGDSITVGDGSTDGTGYRGPLEAQLREYFGGGTVTNQGIEATRSLAGAERIAATFAANVCAPQDPSQPPAPCPPAFVLIHYGTNDWNEHQCQVAPPCYTITSLRTIVETVKAAHSHPFLATIIPVNVGYDQRVPPEREVFVHNQDMLIRQLAAEEGVVLVDFEAAFLQAFAESGDYHLFFSDHVHPSDLGYALMVRTFFQAISQRAPAYPAPSSVSLFAPPGPPASGSR